MRREKKIRLTKETLRALGGSQREAVLFTCELDCITGSNPRCISDNPVCYETTVDRPA